MRTQGFRFATRAELAFAFLISLTLCLQTADATTYEVGDGKACTSIGAVGWEKLAAGDTVNIYYRATPYREKFAVGVVGTQSQPVTIRGVPGPNGELPVLDGQNATTRRSLATGSEQRGLITMQQQTDSPPACRPAYITFENLEIKNVSVPYKFTSDSGETTSYVNASAGMWIADGKSITVRNCYIHDCGNGFFTYTADAGADNWTEDILVEGCYFNNCGNAGSNLEHGSYCESYKITYQYNHYGPVRGTGSIGENLLDRSAGTILRYNWIDGGNRCIDLADAEDSTTLEAKTEYEKSFVYGNVLIKEDDGSNNQLVHFGEDDGTTPRRNGYFYNNTMVNLRTTGLNIFMNTGTGFIDCRNNIIYMAGAGSTCTIAVDSTAPVNMSHNWLKPGYVLSDGGKVNDDGTSVTGASPGFVDAAGQDFHLAAGSPCINAGTTLNADCASYPVDRQYVKHQLSEARPSDGHLDIGAFEYGGSAAPGTTATGPAAGMASTASRL